MSVKSPAADIAPRQVFAGLARNWLRIVLVAIAVTGMVFALAWLATPQYKAVAQLKLGSGESSVLRQGEDTALGTRGVATEMQVMSSADILKQVAAKLNLARTPEFNDALKMSALSRLLVIAGLKGDPEEVPQEERVLKKMREKLNIRGDEKARLIAIEFSSESPRLAADIPNAIANAYIAGQGNAKLEPGSATATFLGPEIVDLQNRVKDADAKVSAFRAQSDLLMGGGASLATQQLSDRTNELSRVRANRASTEAAIEAIRKALRSGGSLASIPEVQSSELTQGLLARQVQIRSDMAELSTTLLDNHPRIRALKAQLANLDAQLRGEAEKLTKGLAAQVQTMQGRESQLVTEIETLKEASVHAGEQQAELDALQRDADARRQVLESYMSRYRASAARGDGGYAPVDARIVAEAQMPADPYFPKILPITGAAFAASLLLMTAGTLLGQLLSGGAARAAADARFDRIEQVTMPVVQHEPDEIAEAADDICAAEPAPTLAIMDDIAGGAAAARSTLGEIDIDAAAEKLIAAGAARAIFVSPEGDEAAASAVLVAREASDAGLRVLLLDLTASGAASRPMLDAVLFPGITNLLAAEAQFSDVIHADHYSDCHVIPVGTADAGRAMRAIDRLPIIMQSLTTAYDLVVVECGPSDAQGIGRLVGEGTEVFLSMLEPRDEVALAAVELIENGYPDVTLVTPVGHQQPEMRTSGHRSAA